MSEQTIRADPNATPNARWPDGPVERVKAAALASGWESGRPDDLSFDDTETDRDIVRGTACPRCGGPCRFVPMRRRSDRRGYRVLSVCRKCRHASEF